MHRALVAAVLVSVALTGCIDGPLSGEPEFVRNTKVDVEEAFSVEDSVNADSPGEKVDEKQFSILEGERNLAVEVEVNFETESPAEQIPSGNVTVNLTDPQGESQQWHYTNGGSSVTTIDEPAAGLWTVVVRATGEGSYTLQIQTDKPAD